MSLHVALVYRHGHLAAVIGAPENCSDRAGLTERGRDPDIGLVLVPLLNVHQHQHRIILQDRGTAGTAQLPSPGPGLASKYSCALYSPS